MRLTVETYGERIVDRDLLRFQRRVQDIRPAGPAIFRRLRVSSERQFDSQGGYGSGGWASLAASTSRAKARLGHDPNILHATHRLRQSLTDEGHPEHVEVAAPSVLTFGSTVPYGPIHQAGGSNLPQRRPMQLPDGDRRDLVKIVQRHFVERTARR